MRLVGLALVGACGFSPAAPTDATAIVDATDAVDAPTDTTTRAAYCDPSDADLIACYEFEHQSTADASGHHHDPVSNPTISFAPGKVGDAVVIGIDGLDVPASNDFHVAAVTIEAWIDLAAMPTGGNRAGVLDCDGEFGMFVHPNGELDCSGNGNLAAIAVLSTGGWIHVACTVDAQTIAIYVGGSVVASGPTSGAISMGGTTGITVGGNNPANGMQGLMGMLDEVRLFQSVHSPEAICNDAGALNCE